MPRGNNREKVTAAAGVIFSLNLQIPKVTQQHSCFIRSTLFFLISSSSFTFLLFFLLFLFFFFFLFYEKEKMTRVLTNSNDSSLHRYPSLNTPPFPIVLGTLKLTLPHITPHVTLKTYLLFRTPPGHRLIYLLFLHIQ